MNISVYDEVRKLVLNDKLSQNNIERVMKDRAPRDTIRAWIHAIRAQASHQPTN